MYLYANHALRGKKVKQYKQRINIFSSPFSHALPYLSDYDKRSVLHLAVATGNEVLVKYLIEQGAKAYAKDIMGNSPWDDAVQRQDQFLEDGNTGQDPVYAAFFVTGNHGPWELEKGREGTGTGTRLVKA